MISWNLRILYYYYVSKFQSHRWHKNKFKLRAFITFIYCYSKFNSTLNNYYHQKRKMLTCKHCIEKNCIKIEDKFWINICTRKTKWFNSMTQFYWNDLCGSESKLICVRCRRNISINQKGKKKASFILINLNLICRMYRNREMKRL